MPAPATVGGPSLAVTVRWYGLSGSRVNRSPVRIHRPTTDIHVVEGPIRAGEPVLLVQRSTPPAQFPGTALTATGNVVAVRLPAPWPGEAGGEVAIIAGQPGTRMLAHGRLAQVRANVASFELLSEWRPVDLRAHPRYPTSIGAEVRSVLGQSKQHGTITDISLGGMAVVVRSKPGGREVTVAMRAGAFSSTLTCRIVNVNPCLDGVVLRLKLVDLAGGQQAFIRNVVASIQAAWETREQDPPP